MAATNATNTLLALSQPSLAKNTTKLLGEREHRLAALILSPWQLLQEERMPRAVQPQSFLPYASS